MEVRRRGDSQARQTPRPIQDFQPVFAQLQTGGLQPERPGRQNPENEDGDDDDLPEVTRLSPRRTISYG